MRNSTYTYTYHQVTAVVRLSHATLSRPAAAHASNNWTNEKDVGCHSSISSFKIRLLVQQQKYVQQQKGPSMLMLAHERTSHHNPTRNDGKNRMDTTGILHPGLELTFYFIRLRAQGDRMAVCRWDDTNHRESGARFGRTCRRRRRQVGTPFLRPAFGSGECRVCRSVESKV